MKKKWNEKEKGHEKRGNVVTLKEMIMMDTMFFFCPFQTHKRTIVKTIGRKKEELVSIKFGACENR